MLGVEGQKGKMKSGKTVIKPPENQQVDHPLFVLVF
jgi:hypothetical protein